MKIKTTPGQSGKIIKTSSGVKSVPNKEQAAQTAIATGPTAGELGLQYVPGTKVNTFDNKSYLGAAPVAGNVGVTAVSPDPFSISDTVRYTDAFAKLSSESLPSGGSFARSAAYRNLTHYVYTVADHFFFIDPALYNPSNSFTPANYTATTDALVAQYATADGEKTSPYIRGVAQLARAMKDAIVAQQNTTNPFYSIRESEMFDRLMDYFRTVGRALVVIQNTRLVLGLQNVAISGMNRWYQTVGRTLFTATNITDLNLAIVEALDAIRGAFIIPAHISEYLEQGLISLMPNQKGAARLFVPRFATQVSGNQLVPSAITYLPGSGLVAATTTGAVTTAVSDVISYLRSVATYFQGSAANIVKSALIPFNQLPQLGQISEPQLAVRPSVLFSINKQSKIMTGAVQYGAATTGTVALGARLVSLLGTGATIAWHGRVPKNVINTNGQLDPEAGSQDRDIMWGRVKWPNLAGLAYRYNVRPTSWQANNDPEFSIAQVTSFTREVEGFTVGNQDTATQIIMAGNLGLVPDPTKVSRFYGAQDSQTGTTNSTLGSGTFLSSTANFVPMTNPGVVVQVSGTTYWGGVGCVPEIHASGVLSSTTGHVGNGQTRGSVVYGMIRYDSADLLQNGSIHSPWTVVSADQVSTCRQPFAGLHSVVEPLNGAFLPDYVLIGQYSPSLIQYDMNTIHGSAHFNQTFAAAGTGLFEEFRLKRALDCHIDVDKFAAECKAFFGFTPVNLTHVQVWAFSDNSLLNGCYTGLTGTIDLPVTNYSTDSELVAGDIGLRGLDVDLGKMAYVKYVGMPDKYKI